jgi:hypothetical protein
MCNTELLADITRAADAAAVVLQTSAANQLMSEAAGGVSLLQQQQRNHLKLWAQSFVDLTTYCPVKQRALLLLQPSERQLLLQRKHSSRCCQGHRAAH